MPLNLSERVCCLQTHALLKKAINKTAKRMASGVNYMKKHSSPISSSPTIPSSQWDLHLYIATEVQHLVVQICENSCANMQIRYFASFFLKYNKVFGF